MKKIILLVVILLVVALGFASHKETVAVGQVGVRTFFGQTTEFTAGETAFVIPVIHRFVMMTTKPVAFLMKGRGALVVTRGDADTLTVECKIRYQIDKPGKFIAAVGTDNSDGILNERLRTKIKEILQQHIENNDLDLAKIETRMLLSGEIIHALNDEALSPGVSIISFELLNW